MDPERLEAEAARIRDAALRAARDYWASAARNKGEGDRLTAEARRYYDAASSDEASARAEETKAGQRASTGFLGF
jgi:hypothetical protein